MNTATMHDRDVQHHVEEALDWAPELDAGGIAVSVHDGVVTLSGQVGSYWQKTTAGATALGTRDVSALANDLLVHDIDAPRTDFDIALAAHELLAWNPDVPEGSVTVTATDQVLTLTGEVAWNYQRVAAQRAVESLSGVTELRNRIALRPRPHASAVETEAHIRRAIVRNASVHASHVHVSVDGARVTLTGTVTSDAERRAATQAAWGSPHVEHVDDRLLIGPDGA